MAKAMLCSGDDQRAWEVRQALSDSGLDVDRSYQSTQALLAALAQYGSDGVDVLVIDESSTPMPMWDLAAEVSGRYPSIAVLTVVKEPTSTDYATALDSGSRGVITYPLNFENVSARVHAAVSWSSSLRKAVQRSQQDDGALGAGKMIAVASAKGGAGSSTVALHLALEAAQTEGRKVILVDLDLQKPDQSILIDAPRQRDITDLLSVIDELSPRFIADVIFDHPNGLSVLFGPVEGEQGEAITEPAAKKILGVLRSWFDVVVVDIGSVMGEANATAVEMADEVCVVSQANVLSLRGVRRLVSLWERIGARRSESVKVVLNGVHRTSDIQPESARKIVALQTYDTVLPRMDRALEQAVNRREPAVAGSEWTQKVRDLGREMQVVPPASLAKSPRGKPSREGRKERRAKKDRKPSRQAEAAESRLPGNGELQLTGPGAQTRRAARTERERGQASIELIGIFAMVLVLAAIAFQAVLVGATWVMASHTASEAARAAAVGHSIVEAAEASTPGPWREGLSVHESPDGRVQVSMNTPVLLPVARSSALPISASAGILEEP
ncbi:AAA family ATPase [Nesterenkonia sp.]|uniref:AAA family ATPase n=1 Tax=Nesterenkonia sp. TaxID=704201 RepID=UPI00262479BF|nr:AAA family ATPase [Nesterenkonia sp.]